MGIYKDSLPSQNNWIHELAKGEVHPEADQLLSGLNGTGSGIDTSQRLEESTIDFLTELRDYLVQYCKIFNSYGENGARFQEIKIYSVANTSADFMLFRSQIKLVFAQITPGVIQISQVKHIPPGISGKNQVQAEHLSDEQPHELTAVIGPFRDVSWTFQGEKVSADQIAKYYFSEFSRATRDLKKHKYSNQQLLNQIRTLLHDKGLEI